MELGCFIDEKGIIQMRLRGNFSSDHLVEFNGWCNATTEAMKTVYAKDPKRVYSIIDVTGGWGFDQKVLTLLIKAARENRPYATKTAVFGASMIMRSFMVIARLKTGRGNIKSFKSRADAECWLFTDGECNVIE